MGVRAQFRDPRSAPASVTGDFLQLPPSLPGQPWCGSRLKAEHWGMVCLQHLSVPQVHMYAARQTRVEASYRAHDIDSLEFVRTVFFKDRRVLHRVLVRPRSAVDVA